MAGQQSEAVRANVLDTFDSEPLPGHVISEPARIKQDIQDTEILTHAAWGRQEQQQLKVHIVQQQQQHVHGGQSGVRLRSPNDSHDSASALSCMDHEQMLLLPPPLWEHIPASLNGSPCTPHNPTPAVNSTPPGSLPLHMYRQCAHDLSSTTSSLAEYDQDRVNPSRAGVVGLSRQQSLAMNDCAGLGCHPSLQATHSKQAYQRMPTRLEVCLSMQKAAVEVLEHLHGVDGYVDNTQPWQDVSLHSQQHGRHSDASNGHGSLPFEQQHNHNGQPMLLHGGYQHDAMLVGEPGTGYAHTQQGCGTATGQLHYAAGSQAQQPPPGYDHLPHTSQPPAPNLPQHGSTNGGTFTSSQQHMQAVYRQPSGHYQDLDMHELSRVRGGCDVQPVLPPQHKDHQQHGYHGDLMPKQQPGHHTNWASLQQPTTHAGSSSLPAGFDGFHASVDPTYAGMNMLHANAAPPTSSAMQPSFEHAGGWSLHTLETSNKQSSLPAHLNNQTLHSQQPTDDSCYQTFATPGTTTALSQHNSTRDLATAGYWADVSLQLPADASALQQPTGRLMRAYTTAESVLWQHASGFATNGLLSDQSGPAAADRSAYGALGVASNGYDAGLYRTMSAPVSKLRGGTVGTGNDTHHPTSSPPDMHPPQVRTVHATGGCCLRHCQQGSARKQQHRCAVFGACAVIWVCQAIPLTTTGSISAVLHGSA